jgi:hypothetical protein
MFGFTVEQTNEEEEGAKEEEGFTVSIMTMTHSMTLQKGSSAIAPLRRLRTPHVAIRKICR